MFSAFFPDFFEIKIVGFHWKKESREEFLQRIDVEDVPLSKDPSQLEYRNLFWIFFCKNKILLF